MMSEIDLTDIAIQWSIRLSFALVFCRVLYATNQHGKSGEIPTRIGSWLWCSGYLLFCLHVFLAFHYVHQWQHENAWQQTAIETEEFTGIRRGDGIWANYLMLVVWGLDCIRIEYARWKTLVPSSRVNWIVSAFIGFMFLNGTLVFGPVIYRYLLFPALLLLFVAWQSNSQKK